MLPFKTIKNIDRSTVDVCQNENMINHKWDELLLNEKIKQINKKTCANFTDVNWIV